MASRTATPRILLNHDPRAFTLLPPGCAHLVLSGHTHGGQVGVQSGVSALTVVGLLGIPDQGIFHRGYDFVCHPLCRVLWLSDAAGHSAGNRPVDAPSATITISVIMERAGYSKKSLSVVSYPGLKASTVPGTDRRSSAAGGDSRQPLSR